MTGGLLLAPAQCPEEKYTHVVFSMDNGTELRFSPICFFSLKLKLILQPRYTICIYVKQFAHECMSDAVKVQYLDQLADARRTACLHIFDHFFNQGTYPHGKITSFLGIYEPDND